jgi:hypothetical protein
MGKSDKSDNQKKKMLHALEQTLGVVSSACQKARISRDTHYRWLKEDDHYREKAEELAEVAIDFVEGQLLKQIKEGSIAGIIFYLKTKGKRRGYSEKVDTKPEPLEIIVREQLVLSKEDLEREA